MNSFRRIDYSLRPAKHAERRMLCDIFRRLRPFGRIEDYSYVGFGSVWFSDFSLFHRALGVKKMLSIEQTETARARIEENKPFNISVDYRHSKDVLPNIDWEQRMFIWLDYDDPLSMDVLADLRTIARRAKSGTAVAISVQCSQAQEIASASQDTTPNAPSAVDRFKTNFGPTRITKLTEGQLYGWNYGQLSATLIKQEIETEIASRNSGNTSPEILFHKICDIQYEDGAKMTTVVGVFMHQANQGILSNVTSQPWNSCPPRMHQYGSRCPS